MMIMTVMITNKDNAVVKFFSFLLSVHSAALNGRGKFVIGERVCNDYTTFR